MTINDAKNKKIVITGASGFIGTNLLQHFLDLDWDVINLDTCPPRNQKHHCHWHQIDLLDTTALAETLSKFAPDYLVHLAARTDLNEKNDIQGYSANTQGVRNLIAAANATPSISRIIFSSSMLVCKFGYAPRNDADYCPDTLYGFSKVESEKIIHEAEINAEWLIVRPTSIWGPWFAQPYLDFFKAVRKGLFLKPGNKAGNATFGYVGNTVYQLHQLLCAPQELVNYKTYYLGDAEPYNLSDWADSIAAFGGGKVFSCPYVILKGAAIFGDSLHFMKIPFPLTSFRLNNMTTDNVLDTSNTHTLAPDPPFTRNMGIKETMLWINIHEKADFRE